ncbi:hypothetical protein CRE_04924 [Caenorhabditis remanei]|uniref:Uncharacterized protein n=1 Tax=Caenorhabditis remanei TaxID=31234 RepID=E3MND6_CAERE|nr:hypothetical protein CRE_04924 [Caenorhabditis remanei]
MPYGHRNNSYKYGGFRQYRPVQQTQNYNQFEAPPPPPSRSVFDFTLEQGNLAGTKTAKTDLVFAKEIVERAANLTPSPEVRSQIKQYAQKVIVALEKEHRENTLPEVGVTRIMHVGSFVTGTSTHLSDKSDVVVQLKCLPSFETLLILGNKIVENIQSADPSETGVALPTEDGCIISSHNKQVRVLVTINPLDSVKLEPELHLDETRMMINHFSLRHVSWLTEMTECIPKETVQEYHALIRVLKDVRSRFRGLQPLSVWALQFLAFHCLFDGPNRQKTNLGTAFRRFFELISAGIFLPKAAGLMDPTAPNHRIGFDLTFEQMDEVCIAAQTLIRVFATGDDGYRAILGTEGTAADLTKTTSVWNGITIQPSETAYEDGCYDQPPSAEAEKIPVV